MDQGQSDHNDAGASRNLEPAKAGDNDPLGGDEGTANELAADNAVEEDMLKALDPDADPG